MKRQVEDWDHLQKQMAACDQDLQTMMKRLPTAEVKACPPPPDALRVRRGKKEAVNRETNRSSTWQENGNAWREWI